MLMTFLGPGGWLWAARPPIRAPSGVQGDILCAQTGGCEHLLATGIDVKCFKHTVAQPQSRYGLLLPSKGRVHLYVACNPIDFVCGPLQLLGSSPLVGDNK